MNKDGCYRNTEEDFKELALDLIGRDAILFSYTGKVTCLLVMISRGFKVIGKMAYGGNPQGKTFVAVVGFGAFWFDLEQEQKNRYICEKLNMKPPDAEMIRELLAGLAKEFYG